MLTERGLSPTPENYSSIYNELSGGALRPSWTAEKTIATERKLDSDRELINLILTLISTATESTSTLAQNLGIQNKSIATSVNALEQTEEKQEILSLLHIISATAHSIQRSVEDTGVELASTKNALDTMRKELQQAREQMVLDPLTGARNRFGMEITLNQEISRVRRSHTSLTLAMLDLDHFKHLNDTHGHDAGDQVLLYFTLLSKSVLRESDVLFRYGGEEFLVLLPDTELNGAIFMLERLQQMLQKSPLSYHQKKISVTFSAGIAGLRDLDNGASLIQRADRALYNAKTLGRNRVEIDTSMAPLE